MNKTDIEWCDQTWNPVTGCLHDCPYCYARQMVQRWQGYDFEGEVTTLNPYDGPALLSEPLTISSKHGKKRKAAFPFGFDPTFHEYRLDEPIRVKHPQTIFVGSMADLFGGWVPTKWIVDIFDACRAAPQHRYLFLTKNPERYMELDGMALLPREDNFWYGSTATNCNAPIFWSDKHNTFASMEPLLAPMREPPDSFKLNVKWVILGAETGNRTEKVVPERSWVEPVVAHCKNNGISVFMKDIMEPIWGDPLLRECPWEVAE